MKLTESLLNRGNARFALRTALVVGSLLALINYGHKWWPYRMETPDWLRLLLGYMVPYAVSIYTRWKHRCDAPEGENASHRNPSVPHSSLLQTH